MSKSPDLLEKRYTPDGYPWKNVPSPELPRGFTRSVNTQTGQTIIEGRPHSRLPISRTRRPSHTLKRG
jgi:hypothetical protein